jgi:hypothetical protein
LAVDGQDRIFVSADRIVLIFNPAGRLLSRLELEEPAHCLAVGPEGLIYLGMNDHIEVYSPAGSRESIWADLGEKALITSIAVGSAEVVVADAGNRMILRYDRGGRLLDYILGDGLQGPELLIPSPYFDLLLTPQGTLWVVNPGRHRLQSYSGEGSYLNAWGLSSSEIEGFGGCCNPTHIALTQNGTFLTSEKGVPRIKEFDAQGSLIAIVAGTHLFAEGTTGLDLATDRQSRVLVLDPTAKTVRVFVRDPKEGK